jgi:hypothetical protein
MPKQLAKRATFEWVEYVLNLLLVNLLLGPSFGGGPSQLIDISLPGFIFRPDLSLK